MAFPSLAQYRALVGSSATMMWGAQEDGLCDYVNDTWLQFTGRSLEQELGRGWTENVHPDDLVRCLDVYVAHYASRSEFLLEFRMRRSDGRYRWLLNRGVPFHGDDGGFLGFIGSLTDIDERRRVDDAKQTFLSMLAHELRTPLMPLRTIPTLLERRLSRGEEVHSLVESLRVQVDRMTALVDKLGTIRALDSADQTHTEVDLWQLVRSVAQARAAGFSVAHSLTLELPSEPCVVALDTQRVEQLLLDVFDNAVKFSPEGGAVRVEGRVVDHVAHVLVRDEGIGIPAEEQSSATRRFFRASNADEHHYPGVGLGLSNALETAQAHGGTLEVDSQLGVGTTIQLRLPLRAAQSRPKSVTP